MSGLVVRRIGPAAYEALGPVFAELARHALEPNPHMAPAAVSAATELVAPDDIVVLCAWHSEALDFERLVGVWALRRARDWRSGFVPVLVAPILPRYEVSSLPVVDRDHALEASRALLRYLLASSDLPHTLALPLLPLEGPGHAALAEACRSTGSAIAVAERWTRPVMVPQPGDDAERYLRRALGPGYKKRMQQLRAVIRSGALTFRRSRGQAALEALDGFLALEAAGWKGKAGTAIACIPEDTAYFRRLAALFAAGDGLQIDTLLLDGQVLAMGLLIESAGRRHFLKIAYDEAQARHSPGRTLTIAMLRADLDGTPPDFFDSGAGDGVDAGTYAWGERRAMGNALIGIGRGRIGLPRAAALSRMALRRLRALRRARSAKAPSGRAPA
ncbi:GNAT family N-acetyltransferase [Bosea minatitlanensis]|uniref:GNAT family N-acetyltransferase n=1 Tax=Bosea minatitlanensis TaxID=128782 RepID=A0ABW0EXN8_9HYPH|nr:GNAT family N-acetyltransferase [Bosea minatitlanensis]MCT4492052.1 GNAT family N-acetyltransferase [Bosea minatitlanensis]